MGRLVNRTAGSPPDLNRAFQVRAFILAHQSEKERIERIGKIASLNWMDELKSNNPNKFIMMLQNEAICDKKDLVADFQERVMEVKRILMYDLPDELNLKDAISCLQDTFGRIVNERTGEFDHLWRYQIIKLSKIIDQMSPDKFLLPTKIKKGDIVGEE